MSHISILKTKIKSFNLDVLKNAILQINELEIVNSNSVYDKYVVVSGDLVVKDKITGRYFAVKKSGEIVVDTYGWSERFSKLKNALVQRYVAMLISQKLQKAGYKVNLTVREGVIVGEGWK